MSQKLCQKLCMWSGPRNLSTAMMRSFGARSDCQVLDEPFFAPYLEKTGKAHPGREETLARHETDPFAVAKLCQSDVKTPYYFQKHMPHHMIDGFPLDWVVGAKHFFLLRAPDRVVASYAKGRAEFDLEDLGFAAQAKLYDFLSKTNDAPPPVLDSADVLKNPKAALTALCHALDIPFQDAMLSWAPGPRADDGAWAPYWYASVEASTGFSPAPKHEVAIDPRHAAIIAACERDYHPLFERRLTF